MSSKSQPKRGRDDNSDDEYRPDEKKLRTSSSSSGSNSKPKVMDAKEAAEILKKENSSDRQQKLPLRLKNKLGTQAFVKSTTLTTMDLGGGTNSNIAGNVSAHYDSRQDAGRERRMESETLKIRNFNNWVKSVLIQLHVKSGDSVLDLCSGKGGDLLKFNNSRIKYYVAADIARNSVQDAVNRYNKMKNCSYRGKFIHADCCAKQLSKGLAPNERFDAVSCQFALHYSFESEQRARQLLQNASERLKEGGMFFCTIPDAYVLMKKLKENPTEKSFGNKFYKIEFEHYPFKTTGPFGIKYNFTLKDAVDNCPEFLVHPRQFVKLAKQFKLNLVEELNFHEFFEKYSQDPTFRDLMLRVCRDDGALTEQEWDAIYIYRVFVFKKEGEKQATSEYNPVASPFQNTGFKPVQENEIISL